MPSVFVFGIVSQNEPMRATFSAQIRDEIRRAVLNFFTDPITVLGALVFLISLLWLDARM